MVQNLTRNSQEVGSKKLCKTISSWLAEAAHNNANAIAISSVDNRPALTYQALLQQTKNVGELLKTLGLKPGDIVAIALDNSADFLTCILSVASAATAFPLIPEQPETEFVRYFDLLDIKAIIVSKDSNSAICSVADSVNIPILELDSQPTTPAGQFSLKTKRPTQSINALQQIPPKLSDDAILVGTSGSTGKPKIISFTHESFFATIDYAAEWMQLTQGDRSLVLTPLAMLHALARSSCPLLLRGGEVVCTPGYDPSKILDWLDRYRPSFFTGVPSMYRSLLQRIESTSWSCQNQNLRFLATGSDRINETEIKAVEKAFDVPLMQFYGMSEVSPLPVVSPFSPAARPNGALGKFNPTWQVACIDRGGNHLPRGTEGEIVIRGGHINRFVGRGSSLERQNDDDGWFHTGDLGYLDDDGWFYYTGRADNRINRGGKKVYAQDVEAILLTHCEVKAAVVFGVPDNIYGETVGAIVVLEENATATPKSLGQFLRKHLVSFKVPDTILIVDALPLNPFGKVKRKTLATHYGLHDISEQKLIQSRQIVRTEYVAPQTETEQKLAAIWLDLLKLPQVSIDDNFFELGGHSLLIIEMFARIESQLGRELPANILFDAPTIAQLAQILERLDDAQPWDCLIQLKSGGNKPALFLVHDADGDVMLYLNLARHLAPERPVYGFRPYGKEGFPILDWTIEQIANRYIERILTVQPDGPYYIGGFCDGGIFAYEVGQQLQAKGHQVGFIALFDTIDYEAVRYDEYFKAVRTVEEPAKHKLYVELLAENANLPITLKNQISVRMILRLAKQGYVPQKFAGKLLLFRATATEYPESETPQYVKIGDPLLGWQKRIDREIEVYDICDHHSGILREPNVRLLADRIKIAFNDCD